MIPEFPQFKPVQLEDRDLLQEMIWKYQPQTSEWTFTNLFIWRSHFGFQWSIYRNWLIVLITAGGQAPYFFQPIGPASRLEVIRKCFRWLQEEKGEKDPRIERADQRLVEEIRGSKEFLIEPLRDQFDYVYESQGLIQLAGRKYHAKRNHISKFRQAYAFTYSPLEERHLKACLEVGEQWCELRRCEDDFNLLEESQAVREALTHFLQLKVQGGVILIRDKVEAFTLGELLNRETGVVHIEKANPEIPGLYPMINQQFCEENWANVPLINREQDLGEPGLRRAKLSYFPDPLVEKFRVRLAEKI